MFENSSGLFSWFFFWPGWNPVGIDWAWALSHAQKTKHTDMASET